MTAPIPKKFGKPWNGPLYDAPDIVDQLERRKIPEGSQIGRPTPAADLSKNFDSMGNLPWETFLSKAKADKRRKNAPSTQAEKPPPKWEELTFAERKVELKRRAKVAEQERQAKKLRQLRGEESSSDDSDSDSSVSRERKRKAELAKNKKSRLQRPRGFTQLDPFAKKGALLNDAAKDLTDPKDKVRKQRKTRDKQMWEDGEFYKPKDAKELAKEVS
jgi:hypothetical protein